jgi:importin subunit alpha-1
VRDSQSILGSDKSLATRSGANHPFLSCLRSWLRLNDQPSLQLEALWALTNIAAGATADHAHALVKHGTVPILVELLSSSTEEVQEQAMWLLGSLAGETFLLVAHFLAVRDTPVYCPFLQVRALRPEMPY